MAFYHMQMQQENIDTGQYQVTVSDRLNNRPIENARVRISYTGAPDSTIEEVATDSSGRTAISFNPLTRIRETYAAVLSAS